MMFFVFEICIIEIKKKVNEIEFWEVMKNNRSTSFVSNVNKIYMSFVGIQSQ